MTRRARLAAGLIGALALASVSLQAWLLSASGLEEGRSVGESLWRLAGYYTIWTNLMVGAVMGLTAAGRSPGPGWHGAAALHIVCVAVVYHALLASQWNPTGWRAVSDFGLHTLAPALMAVWWGAWADKAALRPSHALLWMCWPVAYSLVAMTRGALTGWYPYPFLQVATLGLGPVLVNIAVMGVAFAGLGLTMILAGRRLAGTGRLPAATEPG